MQTGILFLCSRNAVRSPMAHALAKACFAGKRAVFSAGIITGTLDPFAVAAMAEIGFDIADHQPQAMTDVPEGTFDTIIALSPEAKACLDALPVAGNITRIFWSLPDPAIEEGSREQRMAAYRAVRDELQKRIRKTFPAG